MEKPDCYQCKHRASIPGDAHSACNHPTNNVLLHSPIIEVLGLLASRGGTNLFPASNPLNVRGNEHGKAHGWFNWPINYDPLWLEACDGFDRIPESEAPMGEADSDSPRVG